MRTEHTAKWRQIAGHRKSLIILQYSSSELAQDLIIMEKRNLKLVVEMITGIDTG